MTKLIIPLGLKHHPGPQKNGPCHKKAPQRVAFTCLGLRSFRCRNLLRPKVKAQLVRLVVVKRFESMKSLEIERVSSHQNAGPLPSSYN